MSFFFTAVYSLTGTLTRPKLIAPLQMALAIAITSSGLAYPCARRENKRPLTDVFLDGLGIPHLCRVRVQPRCAPRAPLVKQIPALIEGHFELLQLGALLFRYTSVGFLAEELVFLLGKLVDLR